MRKFLTLYSTFLALSKCDIENPGLVEPSKCEACKVGIIIFLYSILRSIFRILKYHHKIIDPRSVLYNRVETTIDSNWKIERGHSYRSWS